MIGLLCPGQGSQFVGMGRDLAEAFPLARATFEEADHVLGTALSRLAWEGPEAELTLTQNAQPAILVHTVAVWRLLEEEARLPVAIAAGHSLGEFSAHVTAGAIPFGEAVRLVRRRGELMYQAGQERAGAMAAILGLDDHGAEEACRRAAQTTHGTVVPANYNSPGQIVISGDVESVARAHETAKELGAKKVIPLNVSGAFHSPLMEGAVEGLSGALASVHLSDPAFPVVSNVTAEAVSTASDAKRLLLQQLTSPVCWVDSVHTMIAAGATRFIEIGPGHVLSGLARRIDRTATTMTLGTVTELEKYFAEERVTWS